MVRTVGRPKSPPKAREILTEILPIKDMFSEEELPIYYGLIDIYLKDFDEDDLTSSDIDDIMVLASNKIIEVRLMKSSRDKASDHLNFSSSLEKLRKQSDKIKDNLASRRKDRVDINEFKGFSIIDLAVGFDDAKKLKLELQARKMKEEQVDIENLLITNTCKDDID
jgi:hypothetical protein